MSFDRDFWDEGACRDGDRADFFPERGDIEAVRRAKTVCARCPVRIDCLEFALSLSVEKDYGIWGGLSRQERDLIRRRRRIDIRAAS